jgi:hypothetical protein
VLDFDDCRRDSVIKKPNRNYKRVVLIRWHLLLQLQLNKELIKLRKGFLKSKKQINPDADADSFLAKLKRKVGFVKKSLDIERPPVVGPSLLT